MILCVIGAYGLTNNTDDVYLMFMFALIGYAMRKFDIPVAPSILALVLGDMAELALRRSLILSLGDPMILISSPISICATITPGRGPRSAEYRLKARLALAQRHPAGPPWTAPSSASPSLVKNIKRPVRYEAGRGPSAIIGRHAYGDLYKAVDGGRRPAPARRSSSTPRPAGRNSA